MVEQLKPFSYGKANEEKVTLTRKKKKESQMQWKFEEWGWQLVTETANDRYKPTIEIDMLKSGLLLLLFDDWILFVLVLWPFFVNFSIEREKNTEFCYKRFSRQCSWSKEWTHNS